MGRGTRDAVLPEKASMLSRIGTSMERGTDRQLGEGCS